MRLYLMFVTAVCVLFLIKLRWPKKESIYDLISPFFFTVPGKVFPVTPLLSGIFVHRVFCAYFDGFQGVGEMRRCFGLSDLKHRS